MLPHGRLGQYLIHQWGLLSPLSLREGPRGTCTIPSSPPQAPGTAGRTLPVQEPQQEGGSVFSSERRQRGKVTRAQRVLALLALAAAEKLLPEDIPPRPALIHTRSSSGLSDSPADTQWKLCEAERGAKSHSSHACRAMCILILLLLAPLTPALPPHLPASRTPVDRSSLASTPTTDTAKGARGTCEQQQWGKDTEMQVTAPAAATPRHVYGAQHKDQSVGWERVSSERLRGSSSIRTGRPGCCVCPYPLPAGPRSGRPAGPAPLSNSGGVGSRGAPKRYSPKRRGDN